MHGEKNIKKKSSGYSKKKNSFSCPEDGGRNLLRNVGDYLLIDTASYS
jgi:hypothetical protein